MNPAIALVRADAEAVIEGRTQNLQALRNQHIFITGGTGFLGTWLLELINVLNEKHSFGIKVTAFSRNAKSLASRWPQLGQQSWLKLTEGDIRHFTELPRDVRYIIHAAALTDRRLLASQPNAVAETNGLGLMRLLRAANLQEDLEKIVILSSGLVYGSQPWDMPCIDETYSGALRCDDVNVAYAESKRFAEVAAQCALSESKLPIVTLRPFAFVGPYQSLQLPWAVTDFMRDSFNGGPIRIMGDGATIRSIMYASDFAFWVLSALALGRLRQVYNVGSPEPIDLGSLAHLITRHFSPPPEIRTRLGQAGHDRTRLVPSVERAKKELSVTVTVPLADAIQRTITWNRHIQSI
ncbi:MAG TPA: NAD(P)-dependent oxidoreductase [Verrucomicrobiae bacterium]